MKYFIEQQIIDAVRKLLSGRVNEILHDEEFDVPVIEFGYGVSPVVSLALCEKSEKERIIRLDAYSLTITFELHDTVESESYCYAYCSAVCMALNENPTLGGIVDRSVILSKKYVPPKKPNCGEGWGVIINLRLTVENQ